MTAERDGGSRRTGQPDLLASLPAERPPASLPDPGIDPAVVEELLTGVRDLREQIAGLREAVVAERPAPMTLEDLREQFAGLKEAVSSDRPEAVPQAVPEVLTREALEAWGDRLVARVGEAARTRAEPSAELPAEPKDEAAAAHAGRIEEAAAKAVAAAERIDKGLDGTGDRVAAEIEEAVTRIKTELSATRDIINQKAREANWTLGIILERVTIPSFGWRTVLACLIAFGLGMLFESRVPLFHHWLWSR